MAFGLGESLQSLHVFLDQNNFQSNKEQVEVIVEDIRSICLQDLSDIDHTCSLLFDKETGIISFLQKTLSTDELQNGKASALSLLSEILQNIGGKIVPYAVDIKDICLSVYSRDRFAKVKNAAVAVIIKILELTASTPIAQDLNIQTLIERLFNDLAKPASKLAATVRAGIYHLLGVLAELHPDLMTDYSDRVTNIYVNALKVEMTAKSKKPEMSIVAGSLEGLTCLLLNFTQSAEEGSRYAYDIFKYVRMALDPSIDYTRYDAPKAALKLLGRHAGQFRQLLMDDYQTMYEKLQRWSSHNNREVLHLGTAALEAFTKEVSEALVEKAKQGQKEKAIFKFFLLKFNEIMNDKYASSKEISMAIKGYGLLAAPCRIFLSESDTLFMLSDVIIRCEHQFFGKMEGVDEKLMSIPSYLISLASIIRQVDSVSIPNSLILEKLIVLLIEHMPEVNQSQQFHCAKSILILLLTLMRKPTVFQQILTSVVYQSVIRTCSHPVVAETSQLETNLDDVGVKKISYKDYISLWRTLLGSSQIKDLAAEDFTLAERDQLTNSIYNELMAAILKILNKLDLDATSSEESNEDLSDANKEKEILSADPVFGLVAKRPKDQQILINIVDFSKDLLVEFQWQRFRNWVHTFSYSAIVLSTKHPLVSGFYKLLSTVMSIVCKLKYFKNIEKSGNQSEQQPDSMEVYDTDVRENHFEKFQTYHLIKKFTKEVLVRMKQYRDELLAACLSLILALPEEIIQDQIADVVPAIQTTFIIGLSYLPLANIGLDALQYWSKNLPTSFIEPYYVQILPYLDSYLRTEDKGSDEVNAEPAVLVKSKRETVKSKVSVRLIRGKPVADQSSESQLTKIKLRILHYLGSLGGHINHALLANSDNEISSAAIAWDTQKHLKFDVPFFDMKPVIHLDPFLPQVVKLAKQSSDRQTKVASCELLHSLVLYALGRGAQMPGETQKKYPMEQLYKKLFPALLNLACDVELVCKELFEPLIFQLIHWFTNNKMAESPETMALLDCIFDGLIQASDMALRDFSAKCLREFLKWSLKQISKKAAEKNPINAKSVLKRIYSFSSHPSGSKRLGAALAFNNIYTVFREEDALVDRFTFEILVHFVESLSLAHYDDKSVGTQEQCAKVLEHLERIMKAKAEMLKKDPGPKIRPEPSAWTSRKLEFAVRWLTRQCGNPQTECRHACMKLVYSLCVLLPGIKSPKDFFAILHKAEGPIYFLRRFEGGGQGSSDSHGLLAHPTLAEYKRTFSLDTAKEWFDLLLAALDCYCWLFGEELMVPSQIFKGKDSERSRIFESLEYFLEHLAFTDIIGAAKLFPQGESSVFTPKEIDDYNRLKCTVIIRLWNFMSILVAKHSRELKEVVPSSLWNDTLWKLLCHCVIRPATLGFNMSDTEIMLNLPKEMSCCLQTLSKSLPTEIMNQLKKALKQELSEQCNLVSLLPINLATPATDYTLLTQMLEGYRLLHATRLLLDNLPKLDGSAQPDLSLKLLINVFEGIVDHPGEDVVCVSLSPSSLSLAKSLLTLSLELDVPATDLAEKLLDKTTVHGFSGGASVSHGDYFLTLMSSTIAASITGRVHEILMAVFNQNLKLENTCVGPLLIAILDHLAKDRKLRKNIGSKLCLDILHFWDKFSPWWKGETSTDNQSLILLILTKLFLIDGQIASDPSGAPFQSLFEMYQKMLKDSKLNMGMKNQALSLLPFFVTSKSQQEKSLQEALNKLVADHFPLKSSEFAVGTSKYKDYITALDKILVAMEMTGSLMLFEILISVYCREDQHIYSDAIQQGINRFVQRLPPDQQLAALDLPFSVFLNEDSYLLNIRRAAVENVCLSMLCFVPTSTVVKFFSNHIQEIISRIDLNLNRSVEKLENQLTTKIGCFQLVEVMYARLGKDEVNSTSSVINQRFCNGKVETGKEMTQKITKCAHDARNEDIRGETLLLELRRQYHCYAHNLLIAIISCVQTELKFYKGFLFQDNINKGMFLLENILDTSRSYEFSVELTSPVQRRKKFVSIRNIARDVKAMSKDTEATSSPSLHLASQYLADSSLTDDLNQFDFNMSSPGQSQLYDPIVNSKINTSTAVENEEVASKSLDYVELEMDALNQHESMAPMIAVIKHMSLIKVTPEVPAGQLPTEMPSWMLYLHDKMTSSSTHINIKLFIAKLVMNCSQIFQPYAKFWIRPFCQLLLEPLVSGVGLTYFAVDIIINLITWHSSAIPADTGEERVMASCVVRLIAENVYHPVRQIYRSNLELLKTLLEVWHDRVEIPYDTIYNLLKNTDPKSQKSTAGIQILGVVLTGKFPPYGPKASVDRDRYLSTLITLMSNTHKYVHAAAAEVIGLAMKWLEVNCRETDGAFHDNAVAQLNSLANSNLSIFITCVHCIHLSYPPLSLKFLTKLLYHLPKLHGQFRALCLEVILGHVETLDNAFLELKGKGLSEYLQHRDEDTQLVSLKIVRAMMSSLKGSELLSLLQTVTTSFSGRSNPACRKIMFDIFMWAYDNYRDMEDKDSPEIMTLTKEALLQGLCDDDLACRLVCQNFWSSNTRLPVGTLERTMSMLEAMYSPNTEPHYLAYATNLLLEATSKSPDYQREIFEHPLSDCTFQDYSLHSSWRQRHAVMTPLFANTFVTQSMDSGVDSLDGGLRATQDVPQFTATMDMSGASKTFNWLTQSSLDTYAEPGSVATGSQLLFKLGSDVQQSRAPKPGQKKVVSPRKTLALKTMTGDNQSSDSDDNTDGLVQIPNDVWRLKRRFIKDNQSQSAFHARLNIKKNKLREEALKERKARREHQVTLYRKYRIGDLPDIQIKYQYIIAPLQALAHRDSTIARLLFSSLFQAIFSEMDKVKTERETEELIQHINNSIEHIFKESVFFFPPFMGSILTILYELQSILKVSPSDLAACAIASNQQTLGVLVLEENLIKSDFSDLANKSKKSRQPKNLPSPDLAEWIQLSRLYKSVNDLDIVQGIFSDQLGTKEETRRAIEAEARGEYKTANSIYSEIIGRQNWEDGDPLDAEIDFWDISRMECLDHLSQWKDLETISVRGVDSSDQPNLDRVWDDGFYQENYLPYVMRSKLKLLLSGDENQQSLLTFVDNCMTDSQKKQYLENRYSNELALMFMWQQFNNRSRYYSHMSLRGFLQDWCNTTTLMVSSRKRNLQQLQCLVELKEFLDFLGPNNKALPSGTASLIKGWVGRLPDQLIDPVTVWDDVVHNRMAYITQSLDHLSQDDPDVCKGLITQLHQVGASLRLAMADSCQKQNNYTLALRLLRETQGLCKSLSNQEAFLKWSHLYASTHQTSARNINPPWKDETLQNITSALKLLNKMEGSEILMERSDLRLEHQILTGEGFSLLAQGIWALDKLPDLMFHTQEKVWSLLPEKSKGDSQDQLFCQLVAKGFNSLKAAVSEDLDSLQIEKGREVSSLEEANLRLAKFCDKHLLLSDEKVVDNFSDDCNMSSFPETIVVCLLNAMKGGSEEARERFPRLLQLSELFPDVRNAFIKKSSEVPSWMFLMWISQMTALLDKPESVVVAPLLTRIAKDYPQALVYSLRMSSEGFDFDLNSKDEKEVEQIKHRKETVDRLSQQIDNVLVNKFISALEQFGQPDVIFKDWCTDMKKILGKPHPDKEEMKRKYQEIYDQLLNVKGDSTGSSTQINYSATASSVGMGEFRKAFADNFKAEFDRLFGKDGSKLMHMSAKDFAKAEATLRNAVDGKKTLFIPPLKLKAYSSWLAEFNPTKFGKDLEIPGQYTGQQKPTPEYHVKIAGFDERVLVMASLRRPKRILIRGNDEQDYPYLVKSGEDLRLDQRIEMLFFMMNKVMNSDWACRQRKLQLKTYQVISMTPRVGLIEWMRNTCPLKNFLYDALTEEEKKFLDSERGPSKLHNRWICKLVNKADYGRWQKIFDEVYLKYSLTETVKEFRLKEGTVPWDLSRRAIYKMSSSPEAFHVLKSAMMRSHAVICICHYLLGIGDRHLSNFMVDLKTGQLIGIDFGHAFGSATQFLPVPELMPFRLTRQLTNLAMPLKVKGQMESAMRHVLRALRADSDLLLRTMDVFVKEPHFDWLNFAERQKEDSTENDSEMSWYPKEKIKIAVRKLKGDHPSIIMKKELKSMKAKRGNVYLQMIKVLEGNQGDNERSSLPHHNLTVEQQVTALIDQATDPNILGRTWTGWEPWM